MARQTPRTKNATIQATTHCQSTTPTAHLPPSSRRIAAMDATQGVYKRENTSIVAASTVVSAAWIPPPNSSSMVETTLSFAMKPLTSEVTMRQSPSPRGARIGASQPTTAAIRLSEGVDTVFRW